NVVVARSRFVTPTDHNPMRLRFLFIAAATLAAGTAAAQSVPEIPFEGKTDFLKLPPNVHLGEVAGVATDAKRHLYVFTRTGQRSTVHGASASQLFEFGPDGSFLREIG